MNHARSPSVGCTRRHPCTTNVCQNGGTCVDEWVTFSCSCPSGVFGSTCQNQVSASFTSNAMGMRFYSSDGIANVTFQFLVSSSTWDGIILSTDNQVRSEMRYKLISIRYYRAHTIDVVDETSKMSIFNLNLLAPYPCQYVDCTTFPIHLKFNQQKLIANTFRRKFSSRVKPK